MDRTTGLSRRPHTTHLIGISCAITSTDRVDLDIQDTVGRVDEQLNTATNE